ncbi:MAG: hypothetical protein A2Y08_04485 [Planctomycetes bacterium GWA2_40_7]|nr:MAG: hypothetical protein A2Y08_04485 [Planctomycetes bacterium GWA2_40_7]
MILVRYTCVSKEFIRYRCGRNKEDFEAVNIKYQMLMWENNFFINILIYLCQFSFLSFYNISYKKVWTETFVAN